MLIIIYVCAALQVLLLETRREMLTLQAPPRLPDECVTRLR